MSEPEFWEAPPFAYNIYDRCMAEGKAARLAGLGMKDCPYPYQGDPDVEFEREAWLDGWSA